MNLVKGGKEMLEICRRMFILDKEVSKRLRRIESLFENGQTEKALKAMQECQSSLRKIPEKAAFFAVKGEGYAWIGHYQEAKDGYEEALRVAINYENPNTAAFLQMLRQRIAQATFFTLAPEAALLMARGSAADSFGVSLLRDIILWCQKDKRWELEAEVWKLAEILEEDPRYKRAALFGRGKALLSLGRSKEALPIFLQIIEEDPESPAPYEYAGGILMFEGQEESFGFLEKAKHRGGSGLGFYRNLFILEIIRKNLGEAKDVFLRLAEEPKLAGELLNLILLGLRPTFFERYCVNFETFLNQYTVKQGYPRKGIVLLSSFATIMQNAKHKNTELRQSFIPLAKEYWKMEILHDLSYHECMKVIYERSEQEAEDFFVTYERILNPEEYWAFISGLKENKFPYGLLLLTYSQFLDIFADVCEELQCPYIQQLHFDGDWQDMCIYNNGAVTFSGRGLLYIEKEDEVKKEIREILRQEH